MTELIATIILGGSFIGMGAILFRKIPVLVGLSEIVEKPLLGNFWQKLKEKIKNWKYFKRFSLEIFLQKVLSKARILSLKTENKTANWLQKLREKYKKEKNQENDNYWQEIKKSKNQEDKED